MPAHGLVLAVAPGPFFVLVTFISGYDHDGFDAGGVTGRFEHMHGAHDIGGVGFDWLCVRQTHQWLRGHVDDDVGLRRLHGFLHGGQVANVADGMAGHAGCYLRHGE